MKVDKAVWTRIEHLRKAAKFLIGDSDLGTDEAVEIALSLAELAGSLEAHAHVAESE